MTLLQSVLFFGLPGLAVLLAAYLGIPLAVAQGIPIIIAWTVALWLPVILLMLVLVRRSAKAQPEVPFRTRFRLVKMTRSHWIAVFAGFVLLQVMELFLSRSAAVLAGWNLVPLPPVLPELFDPSTDVGAGLSTFFGVPVRGNWWLVVFWLGWLILNIGGEELLWRGYVLPRQERIFGRYAWLVNGICWNLLFHAFMWWNYLTLVPISLTVPFLVQRYQNTWVGICIHGLGNLLVLVILIPSIAGWI